MKKFKKIKSLLLIAIILILQSCSNSTERHFGEWKGTDYKGKTSSFILDKNNIATFVINNQVLGGKGFEVQGVKGVKADCKYEIDYSKNPIWLDIVIYEKDKSEEIARVKGIIRFITDNKLEYRLDFGGERFDKFDPEDKKNTIVFDKTMN